MAAALASAPRYHFLTIVAFTLIALGLMRAVLLVVHEPVLGYGDHGDMHRTADCVGLEPMERPSAGLPRSAVPPRRHRLARLLSRLRGAARRADGHRLPHRVPRERRRGRDRSRAR